MKKDIDKYTDEEGDPCFGMPNPAPKPRIAEKSIYEKLGKVFTVKEIAAYIRITNFLIYNPTKRP